MGTGGSGGGGGGLAAVSFNSACGQFRIVTTELPPGENKVAVTTHVWAKKFSRISTGNRGQSRSKFYVAVERD